MHVGWLWAMLRGSRWPRPLQLIRDAGQGSKVEEITSEVLRFGTKLLKLKRLWPYDINHRNNTNTSNNSHIRTEHAFCMKRTHWNNLKHVFHSLGRVSELWTFASHYKVHKDELKRLHIRQFLQKTSFKRRSKLRPPIGSQIKNTTIASFG